MTKHANDPTTAHAGSLTKYNFHGDDLDVVVSGGEHYVVLARLCEPLGLDTQPQWRKLEAAPWAGVAKIATPSAGGTHLGSAVTLASMRLSALLLAAFVLVTACGPSVEINSHGQFPCTVADDCDDDNDCTKDTCDGKLCMFTWVDNGTTCEIDGKAGVCASGVCEP